MYIVDQNQERSFEASIPNQNNTTQFLRSFSQFKRKTSSIHNSPVEFSDGQRKRLKLTGFQTASSWRRFDGTKRVNRTPTGSQGRAFDKNFKPAIGCPVFNKSCLLRNRTPVSTNTWYATQEQLILMWKSYLWKLKVEYTWINQSEYQTSNLSALGIPLCSLLNRNWVLQPKTKKKLIIRMQ